MSNTQESNSSYRLALRRAAPPLAFLVAICFLVIFCYESGHTSLPPTEKRYVTAKAGIASLRQDSKKNMQREPWEKLAQEFRAIYDGDPAWPNRAAALFRSAESLEELARRSCARADVRKAISSYETLALRHAQSRLADDALFRSAQLRAALLRDDNGALQLLARIKKQYPKGDMIAQAIALEKAIRASASGRTAPEAVRTVARASTDSLEDLPQQNVKKQFSGDLPLKFRAAKSRSQALAKDPLRSCWRQPWENLRDDFLAMAKNGKKIAPEALYEAASCQQKLAQCSRLSADSRKAQELYAKFAKSYPRHNLADNALLEAAKLQAHLNNGSQEAIKNLDSLIKQYPKSDVIKEAKRLRASLDPPAAPKAAAVARARSELQVLSWDTISKNSVEIVLEFSAPAKYSARLEKGTGSAPARVVVDLDNADVVNDVRKGVNVNGSLLKAVRVQNNKGSASLHFDFKAVRKFETRTETNPARIILSVAAGNAPVPGPKNGSAVAAKIQKPAAQVAARVKATQVQDLACQLGLTVQRVFIDAGHGGKDPGTSHNKVIERNVTLDVARMLGALLEANGMEVIYSRNADKAVALSERTRMANAACADLFISIHVNANDNPSARGFETYYLDLATNPQAARVAMLENAASDKRLGDMQSMLTEVMLHARAHESRNLAADIQRVSIFRLKKREYQVRSNGVKSAPFHVLLGAKMPAVLVELGYCSNAEEAKNLASPKYRHALAEGLAEGIMAYRDRLLRNRTAGKALTGKKSGAI